MMYILQVIMFLSKSDEETTSNRKLAKDLVDQWVMLPPSLSSAVFYFVIHSRKQRTLKGRNNVAIGFFTAKFSNTRYRHFVSLQSRPIFNKSTRFEDMRNVEDERVPFRRPLAKKYCSFIFNVLFFFCQLPFLPLLFKY